MDDGKTSKYLMLTKTSKTHRIKIFGQGPCKLKFLAVGGGGHEKEKSGNAGAGSGFLVYRTLQVNDGDQIIANVGEERKPSTVSISGKSYTAASGQDGDKEDKKGGDGYSGGGADGKYKGGSNGSKGEGATGGSGTGEDVTKFKFKHWDLSPGDAGQYYKKNKYLAGGGGGVLVNGDGPTRPSVYQGSGYGGGGSGYSKYPYGLPGVILMEVDIY